jgi:S1-C subfamily serine protease
MTTETTSSKADSNPDPSSNPSLAPLGQLSQALAAVVAAASPCAAQIDGGRRLSASGTVYAADGVIVAASHNVERDEDVIVGLAGGDGTGGANGTRRLPARVIGRDAATDLVVLRVEASGLPVPQWAEPAGLAPGQLAILVGRPGRHVRAVLAMISDVRDSWRSPAGGRLGPYVELDAARERGFSGSLVLDAAGRPLGIASSGLLHRRGLLLAASTFRPVVDSLLAHGRVRRGFLGIGAYPVRLPAAQEQELGQAIGLIVVGVQPDGPAATAGLVLGDVLLAIDGHSLADLSQLHAQLTEERIGREVTLRLLRGGEPRDVAVVVGAR